MNIVSKSNNSTSPCISQRYFCQAQTAGVIVQSAVIVQDPWTETKWNQQR